MVKRRTPPSKKQRETITQAVDTVSNSRQLDLRPGAHATNVEESEKPDLAAFVSGPEKGNFPPCSGEIADLLEEHAGLYGGGLSETDLPIELSFDPKGKR